MARTRAKTETAKRQQPKRVPPLTTSRTFGQKSPLVDIDIQSFLARCMSTERWESYTDVEKRTIMQSLPPSRRPDPVARSSTPPGDLNSYRLIDQSDSGISCLTVQQDMCEKILSRPPVNPPDLTASANIKRAVARFKRDLADGYYEKAWQNKARRAHEERMQGKFDEYVRISAQDMFEDDVDGEDGNDQDELAQFSEDGEYLDTSRK